jgi:hypothetical protein
VLNISSHPADSEAAYAHGVLLKQTQLVRRVHTAGERPNTGARGHPVTGPGASSTLSLPGLSLLV